VASHHLDLFTLDTWEEFLQHGASVTGFREGRWSRVQKIEPGDVLLCYVIGLKRWIGVLEVTGPPFFSAEPPIWASDPFPSRLPVRVVHQLTPETGVPQRELIDRMPMFSTLANPQREWGGHFLGSPRPWPDEDAQVVLAAIEQAVAHPVTRPIGRVPRPSTRVSAEESEAFGVVAVPDVDEEPSQQVTGAEVSQHGEVQARLIDLGAKMGYRVFLARNDRSRIFDGQRLGDRAAVIEHLPLAFDAATTRIVELIDVIWLRENSIAAVFEVESTTSVYSGLLRMSDLLAMQPNLVIPIFIVAPETRRDKVMREVNRPTFKRLNHPLDSLTRFISFESLREMVERHINLLGHLNLSYVTEELSDSCELESL
jgi:hypothetical protein